MPQRESRPGAVVIGGDFHGLGIVRSLGRRGIRVCIIDDERSISKFSRYATHAVHVADLRDEGRTVDVIEDTGRRLGLDGWVLFATRDQTVAAIARHHDRLAKSFRLVTPPWSAIQYAWDKRNTYRLAEELGIPTPRTWYPEDEAGLEEVAGDPPFTIKPSVHERFMAVTKAKAWRADDRDELRDRFIQAAALVEPGQVMIQEFVPGDGRHQFSYCAFYRDGEAIGLMVARRRRQHPPEFGRASTFVETVDVPLIEEYSRRFLDRIGYYGLVELEYKRDPRDGEYKLLDVNARTWGYHTLGQAAGVDFPYLVYADLVGEPVVPARARSGVRWVRLVTDAPTGFLEIARRNLSLRDYLRSLATAQTEAVMARDDPLPWFAELALIPYLAVKRGF
jgi:predicted ATP-grasp superfamily ATP-dependent carboligase